jgi:hypothetical protein
MPHHRPIACDSWCPAGWADVHGGQVVERDAATPWTRSLLQWRSCFDTDCISWEGLTEAVQPPARVNVTCVTPLGEEVASTW